MRKAIGFAIVVYTIVHLMNPFFTSFQEALVATFHTVKIAAEISEAQLREFKK